MLTAEKLLSDITFLPKLIVFDLDYTLWPFWCDTHISPPFHFNNKKKLMDKYKHKIELYDNVIEILSAVKTSGILIGYASRTDEPTVAEELLEKLELNQYVTHKEIYPGSKVKHFSEFRKELSISYDEMVFFDDEKRNLVEISKLGVTCQYVDNGLSLNDLKEALGKFQTKQK